MVTSTSHAIQAAARRHNELLRGIDELDYAPPALEQCSAYIKDLQQQKKASDGALAKLAKKTEKERKEALELKNSVARKWSQKLTGQGKKYEAKVSKEERDYMEAMEGEQGARSTHERITADLAEAKSNEENLRAANEQRTRLKKELDVLYERVFSGSSPEFPQEDILEDGVVAAEAANHETQAVLTSESQTLAVLSRASKALQDCAQAMASAKDMSTYDVWGGGIGADWMEGDALFRAQTAAVQFGEIMSQARRMSHTVRDVPVPFIPRQSMSDVMFDNVFTDMAMHDKIKKAVQDVQKAQALMKQVYNDAQQRVNRAETETAMTGDRLTTARKELYDLRAATFASVVGGQGGHGENASFPSTPSADVPDDPPPAWSALGPSGQEVSHAPPTGPPPSFPDAQLAPMHAPAQTQQATGAATQHAPPPGPPPGFPYAQVSHAPPAGPPPSGAPSGSYSAAPAGGITSPGMPGKPVFASRNPYAALLAKSTAP